mmetsp:Transcript_53134/g.124342  ORF Transcript_53134/g.124342 Transcript_53134/m.124342 type:complete len:151 (+) Transcript_53134:4873-5325(+)
MSAMKACTRSSCWGRESRVNSAKLEKSVAAAAEKQKPRAGRGSTHLRCHNVNAPAQGGKAGKLAAAKLRSRIYHSTQTPNWKCRAAHSEIATATINHIEMITAAPTTLRGLSRRPVIQVSASRRAASNTDAGSRRIASHIKPGSSSTSST